MAEVTANGLKLFAGGVATTLKSEPGKRRGKSHRRIYFEAGGGYDYHRASGRLNYVEQVIDREHGRYVKRILAPDGTILRDDDKALVDHQGHGAAKAQEK
jgi:hypothetical protein